MIDFFTRFGTRMSKVMSATVTATRFGAICRTAVIASCAVLPPVSSGWANGISQWDGAEKWVGHQPSESLSAEAGTFFDLPAIAEQLPRMLTPIKRARFDSYSQTSRVERVGHFLVTTRCKAGDCEANNAVVILDMNSKNIWFVLHANEEQEVHRCWIGTAQYQVLPQVLQASFTTDE